MKRPGLEQIASTYIDAANTGTRTTSVVAETYGVSMRTATNWVRDARAAGLLDGVPTTGKVVGIPHKVIAVADALGVSAEKLTEAILEHAGGDLRIKSRTIES